ncbi:hypothetical protein PLICRDRAFT_173703 [Plicaturopsis crispa FD-325 SS-3]|nr:hypothetical protein PLICRDRAFT_173703 [Plicaturopsis crispa FD-325 SS-3]
MHSSPPPPPIVRGAQGPARHGSPFTPLHNPPISHSGHAPTTTPDDRARQPHMASAQPRPRLRAGHPLHHRRRPRPAPRRHPVPTLPTSTAVSSGDAIHGQRQHTSQEGPACSRWTTGPPRGPHAASTAALPHGPPHDAVRQRARRARRAVRRQRAQATSKPTAAVSQERASKSPASAVSSHGVAPRLAVLTEHQHPRVAEHDGGGTHRMPPRRHAFRRRRTRVRARSGAPPSSPTVTQPGTTPGLRGHNRGVRQ